MSTEITIRKDPEKLRFYTAKEILKEFFGRFIIVKTPESNQPLLAYVVCPVLESVSTGNLAFICADSEGRSWSYTVDESTHFQVIVPKTITVTY